MSDMIAIVSGSNKGIGLEIARKLTSSGVKTIIACRNDELGRRAQQELGSNAEYINLNIDDDDSINTFASAISSRFGKVDILVNNAAIAFKGSDPTPFINQARPTLNTNYFSTLKVTEKLLPLLKKSNTKTIVNVASLAGHLRIIKSPQLRSAFENPSLTMADLSNLMNSFITSVENKSHEQQGFPSSCYGMSKVGVVAMTKVLARENPDMLINCCCPGYCATDMSSHRGSKTAEEGARTPFYLAMMLTRSERVSGKFFADEKQIQW